MTEYITKDQVLKIIDNVEVDTSYWAITRDGYVTPKPDTFERLHTEINNLIPADVVEVVHGEWRYVGSNWECSNCLFPVYSKSKFYRYCPQCGARMDGGESK